MQLLSCKTGESIRLGEVSLIVLAVSKNRVKLGIEGPRNIPIRRAELPHLSELASAGSDSATAK